MALLWLVIKVSFNIKNELILPGRHPSGRLSFPVRFPVSRAILSEPLSGTVVFLELAQGVVELVQDDLLELGALLLVQLVCLHLPFLIPLQSLLGLSFLADCL